MLDVAGIDYELDPRLVRGLDYYTRTVFEFRCDALGAQSGIGGGGRYDRLIEQLGGPPTPGAGWATGLERIEQALAAAGAAEPTCGARRTAPQFLFIVTEPAARGPRASARCRSSRGGAGRDPGPRLALDEGPDAPGRAAGRAVGRDHRAAGMGAIRRGGARHDAPGAAGGPARGTAERSCCAVPAERSL